MDPKLLKLKKTLKFETFGKMFFADVEAPERPEKVLGENITFVKSYYNGEKKIFVYK